MYRGYNELNPDKIEINRKPKALICDIDGCILDSSRIYEEIAEKGLKDQYKWEYFEKYANDPAKVAVNNTMVDVVNNICRMEYKLIFSTARSKAIKIPTVNLLKLVFPRSFEIYMRDFYDLRSAARVKEDHLEHIRQHWDAEIAIDDEDENLEMFSNNGLVAIKVIKKGKQA